LFGQKKADKAAVGRISRSDVVSGDLRAVQHQQSDLKKLENYAATVAR
jgi:hypothetical protein